MKIFRFVLFRAAICVLPLFSLAQDATIKALSEESVKEVKKDEDTTRWNWKKGGSMNLAINQGSLSNWAAGGDNFSLAVSSYLNYFVFYKNKNVSWDNNFDFNLGYVQTTSLGGRKNDDRFDFLSKYDYLIDKKERWFLSALFNFRSQFFDGYTFKNNVGTFSSSFLAPAYQLVSIGFDLKPIPRISCYASPITSRLVIVANDNLSKIGAYGVDSGHQVKSEIGGFATFNIAFTIDKEIAYKGRLDLFSNYLHNPENIDIYMSNRFSFRINRHFSATYSLDFIYDDDVRIFGPEGKSPGLQTKSQLGIGYLSILRTQKRLSMAKFK